MEAYVCMQDNRESSAAAPAADVEFLLDALSRPATSREARKLFSRGVVNGWINQHHVRLLPLHLL